ncbi:MAG: tetratricopeptide repeat protein [Balneola sp.]|nr:tetratricopeptide repeat protein [Balneola sp.]
MKYLSVVIFAGLILACSAPAPNFTTLPEDVQTVSLLGDTLQTNSAMLPQELAERIDSLILLERSRDAETEAVIWEARYLGYNGEYRKAVDLLSKRIEQDSKNPALYRHRGHRYISLRVFDLAIKDLEKAAELIKGTEDVVEQDGLPNEMNSPTSSLHTNIWYHLGLAYYLTGDFENAQKAYAECINASTNDDMMTAALYWYYMSLRRDGQDEFAGKIIDPVRSEMNIIENDSYHKLLLVFKGEFDPNALLDTNTDALSNATVGYGIGNWHYINGRKDRAMEIWRNVYDAGNWSAFGFIASEAELAKE